MKLLKVAVALLMWLPMVVIAMVMAAGVISVAVAKTVRDLVR